MRDAELERRRLQAEYDNTHSQLERNIKGQFATPYDLAKQIASDALGRHDGARTFLEPSCGTGAFVSAIRECNASIEIVGIEKDPVVSSVANKLWGNSSTRFVNDDFFDIAPTLGSFDLLITNPPYSRHHHLSSDEKTKYTAVVEQLSGYHLSQLAGLHAYFILAGTSLLNPGGIASWLIPAELFSVNYGRVVRDYITRDVTIERIHFFDNKDLQFDNALVSSCVLVLRKKKTEAYDKTQITAGDFSEPNMSEEILVNELKGIEKWQHFFNRGDDCAESLIGDFFSVKRGLSTGAESFYAKERAHWHELGIGDEWLTPVLPAPRFMHDAVIEADESGWPTDYGRALLNIPMDMDEASLSEAVKSYLRTCPEKVRNSYTAKHRKRWYAIEQRQPAPVVCTYMSRSDKQPFRFVRNKSKAVVTTAYLCLYPKITLTDSELDELCISLNDIPPLTLIKSGREYGGGLKKLEPKELLSVPFDTSVVSKPANSCKERTVVN
ncbi:Eco57I restriction-modification methylase domain-containing protein [Raoultibacter timonensis]|uniref:Eco57I restriction-modification methylase domain-containing protein n=1 Tax=Raoultibacter timonensis TaxID=1907662 RepID=UPI000C81F586|nr:N-6 DNA methylase [Raoultibacter timonensis]